MHSREWVYIVELVLYIPAAVASLLICRKHGFGRSSGWVFTFILCLVRTTGAICQLISYHDSSSSLTKALIIIDSIGLSPLLLATLGMLSRFVDSINAHGKANFFTLKHFRLIQLLITLGLILSIAGGTSGSTEPNGSVKVATTAKVGIALYIVAFVALTVVCFASSLHVSNVPIKEGRVPLAVVVALPFIAVRLVYAILTVTFHDHLFNPVNGDVLVLVVMSVVEEFTVVAIYLLLGFSVDRLSEVERGPLASRAWKNKNSRGGHGERHSGRNVDEEHAQELRLGSGHTRR